MSNKTQFEPGVIPPFVAGSGDTPLSARRMNQIVTPLNALMRMKVRRGQSDGFFLSEGNAILQLKDSTLTDGGGTGAGNMLYRGAYDDETDYEVDDVVTTTVGSWPVLWICVIANGPSSSVQAPTWPEPGTVYWKCLSYCVGARQFYYKSASDNYWTCSASSGPGADDVYIARQPSVRCPTSRTIGSVTYSYDYTTSGYSYTRRKCSWTVSSVNYIENQVVTPRLNSNDVIMAIPAVTGLTVSGAAVILLDTGNRAWGRESQ